jgi:hypothetical protein
MQYVMLEPTNRIHLMGLLSLAVYSSAEKQYRSVGLYKERIIQILPSKLQHVMFMFCQGSIYQVR